jgi:hypothetical protein
MRRDVVAEESLIIIIVGIEKLSYLPYEHDPWTPDIGAVDMLMHHWHIA